jgi:uncharacterized membrane protein
MTAAALVPILVATIASFVLGGLWYGPLFGAMWMAENRYKAEDLKRGFNPAIAYGLTFVLGLVSAALFAAIIGPHPSLGFATGLGFAIGVCWVSASIATNYLFERRPLRLFFINAGYHTLRFGMIGFTFGLIG